MGQCYENNNWKENKKTKKQQDNKVEVITQENDRTIGQETIVTIVQENYL